MPERPELSEVFLQILEKNAESIRTIGPGEVKAWNRTLQVADIQPLVRDKPNEQRAMLYRIPVIQPVAYHDIQVGEVGLILTCDRNPARWWRDGTESDAETAATHSASNAIFLPGLRSSKDPRSLLADSAALLRPKAGGTVRLGIFNATKSVLHEDLLSDLNTFFTKLNTWASTPHTNWAAAAAAWIAINGPGEPVVGPIAVLQSGIASGAYESPSVMVED